MGIDRMGTMADVIRCCPRFWILRRFRAWIALGLNGGEIATRFQSHDCSDRLCDAREQVRVFGDRPK